MTLANRLRLLTGVVMLCIMLLSGLLMHQMERVFEHANYGNTDSVSSLAILDKLQEGFLIVRIELRKHILTTDQNTMASMDILG